MFLVCTLFIYNTHQSIGINETETKSKLQIVGMKIQSSFSQNPVVIREKLNQEQTNIIKNQVEECCLLFFQKIHKFPMTKFIEEETDEISRTLFNLVLDNINFPIKNKTKDVLKVYREYTINKRDVKFRLYYKLLRNNYPNKNYSIKEKENFKFTESLAEHTRKMFATLLCINFNVQNLSPNAIRLYIDKYMKIKMGTKLNYQVKKVFDLEEYFSIYKNILYGILEHNSMINFERFNQYKKSIYDDGKVKNITKDSLFILPLLL
ncbi:uncharacterized protein VNE69_06164 [Vairimorpha necatrix]|uniref:Uncharacterized protein n=1 Tax=Vairimorpha necatrix TaxID=6039 RepID=A0AAX4JCW4_9MICR